MRAICEIVRHCFASSKRKSEGAVLWLYLSSFSEPSLVTESLMVIFISKISHFLHQAYFILFWKKIIIIWCLFGIILSFCNGWCPIVPVQISMDLQRPWNCLNFESYVRHIIKTTRWLWIDLKRMVTIWSSCSTYWQESCLMYGLIDILTVVFSIESVSNWFLSSLGK